MPKAKPILPIGDDLARFGRAGGASPVVDRNGGRFGAGIIRGVSLSSVGEAKGHGLWLDEFAIKQVVEHSQTKGETGLKCRFTHPGMSSDGMGRHLGRLRDVRFADGKAVGDLHFAKSAHDTPDGDLAEYVMTLTEEDPAAAGLSIVFRRDRDTEREFRDEHTVDKEYTDADGETRKTRRFVSPDKANTKNLEHCRVGELMAADVVDEPAANPDGMFDAQPLARNADALLSYAAGLTKEKPDATAMGIDSDRASQFLGRWLDSHGLSIVPDKKESDMAEVSHEEFDAFKQATEEKLSKVLGAVEKLADASATSQAELAAERRKNEIHKLCQRFKDREKGAKLASQLIADESLSVADCKLQIADALIASSGPVRGDTSREDEKLSAEKKAERDLRAKYEEGQFSELGIDWDQFQEQEKCMQEMKKFEPVTA